MKIYNFELMGLRTVLRTPGEITISDNLRPFLSQPHPVPDCTITVETCGDLPAFSGNGVWHGLEYYDHCEDAARIFHCHAPYEAAFAVTQLFENGNIKISLLPEYLSYFTGSAGVFNRIGMETMLLQHKGLLLHASLIKYNERAIAFSGASGVGKSTQAELWCQYQNAEILNGDRAALRNTENGWVAYGSPYAGTSSVYRKENAPLAAVVVLRQGQENRLQRISGAEALGYLYPELAVHRWQKDFVEKVTELGALLVEQIPMYLLECRPDESAVLLLKKGLGL